VKLFGEPVVAGMEKGSEFFPMLMKGDFLGMWEHVQEDFGDLKEMVIEQIKEMVITQVITAGVKWIIGLLNPASAFVKAAMAIYDIVMFFINRGSQIMDLVNAIIDAVTAIASGAVGGAAQLVENALAKSLPVVIGFLASLLGIGDFAKKVQGIVEKIRLRIDKAIEKLLLKAKRLFKGKGGATGATGATDETTNHKVLAKQAVSELKQTGGEGKDYETLRKEKELQAKQIEQTYTKKLEQGIKLSVKFDNAAKDKDDGDLDFKVVIAPNDTVITDKISGAKDEAKGAFALYRGIHFKTNWNKEDYDTQLEKKLVGEPTFSGATLEIAGSKKPDGSDVSQADKEAAAKLVREKVESTKDPRSVKQWWNKKQQVFDNLFLAMLQDYVNRYTAFEAELQKANNGQYSSLEFIKIPFISTSKKAAHAASYALGEKGTLTKYQRTIGTVGRLFVYLFTAKQLVEQGAINIQDLQNKGKVKIKARTLKEGEVAFVGSIPGENQVAQHDATVGDSPAGLGNIAENTAQQQAQNQGGLREWES
jgi:hypothetical protein